MMSDEEILELVKEHFEFGYKDSTNAIIGEAYGPPEVFLKFAREIFQEGYNSGHTDGYYSCYMDSDEGGLD